MSVPPHIQEHDQVVLFDGVCKLCNAWSQFLIKHDKEVKFKLCTVQSKEGQDILRWFGMPADTYETIVLVKDGKAHVKSEAILTILAQLNRPLSFLSVLTIFPKSLRDWFYDRIAQNRYKLFGKYDECVFPSEKDKQRFLGSL